MHTNNSSARWIMVSQDRLLSEWVGLWGSGEVWRPEWNWVLENEFNSGWKTVGGSRVNRTASRGNYLKINLDEWMKSQNTGLQCVNAPKAHSQPLVGAVFDCLRMGQKKEKKNRKQGNDVSLFWPQSCIQILKVTNFLGLKRKILCLKIHRDDTLLSSDLILPSS